MTKDKYNELKIKLVEATKIHRLVFEELKNIDPDYTNTCNAFQNERFTQLCTEVNFLNTFFKIHEEKEMPNNVIKFKKNKLTNNKN